MDWIGVLFLWLMFATSIPAMAIERFQKWSCWLSGFTCACAILTTVIVAAR